MGGAVSVFFTLSLLLHLPGSRCWGVMPNCDRFVCQWVCVPEGLSLCLGTWTPYRRMYLWWSLCTLYLFTRVPGESYRRRLGSLLLFLCDVCRALINSLVCCFCRCVSPLVFVVVDECCSRVRSACLSAPIESFQTTHQPQVTYCPPHPYLPSVPVSFSLDVEPVCLSSLSDWTINASFSPP